MASALAKKAAGTFVEDSPPPKMPVSAWIQEQCRIGSLSEVLNDFCRARPELLDPRLVVIDRVADECIQGHIPCRLADQESPHTFLTEVHFRLDPRTGEITEAQSS